MPVNRISVGEQKQIQVASTSTKAEKNERAYGFQKSGFYNI